MATTQEIDFQRRLRADKERAWCVYGVLIGVYHRDSDIVRKAEDIRAVAGAALRAHIKLHGDIADQAIADAEPVPSAASDEYNTEHAEGYNAGFDAGYKLGCTATETLLMQRQAEIARQQTETARLHEARSAAINAYQTSGADARADIRLRAALEALLNEGEA